MKLCQSAKTWKDAILFAYIGLARRSKSMLTSRGSTIGIVTAAVVSTLLVGCGSGSESVLQTASSNPDNQAKGSGLVATNVPITNATVVIKCAGGTPITTSTDSTGRFSFSPDKQLAPCVVRATGGQEAGRPFTQTLHSVLSRFDQVNVTPLTDLLVARLSAETVTTFYDQFNSSGGRSGRVNEASISAASAELRQYLQALGVNVSSLVGFNILSDSFSPRAGDPHAAVIESLTNRLAANATTFDQARSALVSFSLPGPCSNAAGFCWPVTAYKLLAEGRSNEKNEPEAKFHEHDVNIDINASGLWVKSVQLKADKVGKVRNFDLNRPLSFTSKYQSNQSGACNYAMAPGERCYEALAAAMVMVCGPAALDDVILMPAPVVQKDSTDEVKKEASTPLHGLVFDRIVNCSKASTSFAVSATGQVTDETGTSIGPIANLIGKDAAKKLERKFWRVSAGSQTRYVGIELGEKSGQPVFTVLVSR